MYLSLCNVCVYVVRPKIPRVCKNTPSVCKNTPLLNVFPPLASFLIDPNPQNNHRHYFMHFSHFPETQVLETMDGLDLVIALTNLD